nr:retrotransposon protein, putative, Ty1-copia subclass [Tanacetum cinerariifolium]
IVLSIKDELNYLEQPIPLDPVAPVGQQVAPEILAAHNAWIKGSKEIVGLMLMTLELEIQRNLEPFHAHEMLWELKTLFAQQAEQELLQTTRDFHSCRQEEDQSVSSYVLKMNGYIDNLERHWKRNCPQYLAELLKKKKNAASGAGGLGIFVIELNTILNSSWIYDTGCGTHICNTTQGLRASRKLKPGDLSLYRRNRTLLDMVRSMMSQTTLPKSFWDYVLETAARILNMVPTKKVEKTPYEVWHRKAPKLSYLKVLGCEALVKRDTLTKPDNLEPRSIKCIFVGYPKETMGYSFYYPPDKVLVARNAEFLENSPQRHAPDRMCLYIDAEEHELGDLGEPTNYKAALLGLESEKWLNAINVEMQSMKYNEVMILFDLPPNGKTIGSKWLFKKKTHMDGNVHTYKARLVAKGYTQTSGIDFEETFSPVADIRAIRILIAIATYYDYEIWNTKDMFLLYGEAEYIAAFDASKEAVWVRKFISGLGVVPTIEQPIIHYLREVIEYGDIKLEKVHTYDNLADPFTKALAFPKHSEHTRNIGMLPASSRIILMHLQGSSYRTSASTLVDQQQLHIAYQDNQSNESNEDNFSYNYKEVLELDYADSLNPSYHFSPTDSETIVYYLWRKIETGEQHPECRKSKFNGPMEWTKDDISKEIEENLGEENMSPRSSIYVLQEAKNYYKSFHAQPTEWTQDDLDNLLMENLNEVNLSPRSSTNVIQQAYNLSR